MTWHHTRPDNGAKCFGIVMEYAEIDYNEAHMRGSTWEEYQITQVEVQIGGCGTPMNGM